MKKYYYLAAFVSVLVLSWLIQTQSGRFYAQPIIEVQTVQITADQQQIQGIVRNGEEAGVLRTVTTQYTPNGAIHPLYQTGQQLLLQKEGDGWQVQAQKRDGYLFFFLALFLMAVVAIGGKKGLRALLSIFVNTGLLLLFLCFYDRLIGFDDGDFLWLSYDRQPQNHCLVSQRPLGVFSLSVRHGSFARSWVAL